MDQPAPLPNPGDETPDSESRTAGRSRSRKRGSDMPVTEVAVTGRLAGGGLHMERHFTRDGVHPFDEVTWEKRTSSISNEKGEVVFEQRDVEVPSGWSQMATNVVVSKYFRGPLNSDRRETSVRQVISRVCDTIARWGREGGYFATEGDAQVFQDELTHLVLHQRMSFNSPVWFNIGVPGTRPQASACQPFDARVVTPRGLIPIGELVESNSVGEAVFDRDGVTHIVATKANGRKEVFRLTTSSGVTLDATADHLVLVASDPKGTRCEWKRLDEVGVGDRLVVDAQHRVMRPLEASVAELAGLGAPRPYAGRGRRFSQQGDVDVWERLAAGSAGEIAVAEASLAGWLQGDGYVGWPRGCTSLVAELQPADAEELAEVERLLDVVFPGVHRHVTRSHAEPGRGCYRVRLSGDVLRPFVEKWGLLTRGAEMRAPARLWSASTEEMVGYLRSLFQADGYVSIKHPSDASPWPAATVGLGLVAYELCADVQQMLLSLGIQSVLRSSDAARGRQDFHTVSVANHADRLLFAELIGFPCARKAVHLHTSLHAGINRAPRAAVRCPRVVSITSRGVMDVFDIQTESENYLSNHVVVHNCFINSVEDTMDSILKLAHTEGMLFKYGSGTGTNLSPIRSSNEQLAGGGTASGPVSFMRGFDAFAGVIKSGGTTRRAAKMVILNVDHPDVEEFVTCKVTEERKAWALIDAGYDGSFTGEAYASIFFQNSNNSVRVTDDFMRAVVEDREWHLRAVLDPDRIVRTIKARELMRLMAESAHQCGDPGIQYDTTINDWHTSSNTARINASNPCSEYMYLDDSACNLASLNLMTFLREDGTLDIDGYRHAVHTTITAQEILVGNAEYPTPKITENSLRFRPLGLGYANLGALLMARGVPYDSPQGRELAACVTAIMTGEAYAQSARIAREVGPFDGYAENRQPMLRVIGKHREAAYRIPDEHVETQLVTAARRAWDEAHELGAMHGYRNGQATVLAPTGCLTPDTLVSSSRGLVRLRSLGNPNGSTWQDLDVEVATHEGPRKASKFFINGVEPVVTVETRRGFRLRGTTTHRVKVVDADGQWQWRRLADITSGDRVPMMLGGMIGEPVPVALPPLGDAHWAADHDTIAPRYLTPELAELAGYFMGDGSLHSKGLRFCVSPQDTDLADHLADLGHRLFGITPSVNRTSSYIEVLMTSVRLVMWWQACGFAKTAPAEDHHGKGWLAHIPDAVLHTNNPAVYGAFVRGLFEADGTVSTGYPSFTTVTESLARDVQTLLLTLGFVSTLDVQQPGAGAWGRRTKYRVRLLNVSMAARFADEIGFASARKRELCRAGDHQQAARHDHVPLSREQLDRLAPANDGLRKALLLEHRRSGAVSRRAATALLERTADPELQQSLAFFYDRVATVSLGEEDLTLDISVPENVTYVANGFVSHNTIGFMMDCDTTGVEPDIALVKYKKLVGGGMLKIVNQTVPQALRRLGYGDAAVNDVVAHIDSNDTIEGAPHLREEDLAVFDCAFRPASGSRSIAWQGHIRMMGAVQPFLSGAISKTANMPSESTVDDVEQAYIDAWRMGLKALAIYRDGSKRSQPMATSIAKTTGERVTAVTEVVVERPLRKRLPAERQAITHKFAIADHEGYLTVGLYEDGTPGEIFLKMAKEGSTVSGLMDSFATAVSMALQYGVPLQALCTKFSHARFEPSGFTGNPEIPIAKSIMDYIFRWMASRFLNWEERDALGIIRRDGTEPGEEPAVETRVTASPVRGTLAAAPAAEAPAASVRTELPVVNRPAPMAFLNQEDAPSCSDCGSLMVRSGACYKCLNCGTTSGCS